MAIFVAGVQERNHNVFNCYLLLSIFSRWYLIIHPNPKVLADFILPFQCDVKSAPQNCWCSFYVPLHSPRNLKDFNSIFGVFYFFSLVLWHIWNLSNSSTAQFFPLDVFRTSFGIPVHRATFRYEIKLNQIIDVILMLVEILLGK